MIDNCLPRSPKEDRTENLLTERRVFVPDLSELISIAKRSTKTKTLPFDINSGNSTTGHTGNLIDVLDADQNFYKSSVVEDELKSTYYSVVRPACVPRCLLAPFKLDDPRAAGLHDAYKRITGQRDPYYISSRDLMIILKCMKKGQWGYFLDFLSAKRVLIIEDWFNSYGTLFGSGKYDHGMIPPDGTEFYKGECDASVKDGKARICAIIWKGNQVIACQLIEDIPIEQKKGDEKGKQASAKAEAIGMYYLLKLALSKGIENLQVSTDNRTVDEVLRGIHEISEDNNCKEIYRVLRYLKRYFSVLVSRWEPRENLYFPDGLIRSFKHGITPGSKNSGFMRNLLRKWSYHLNGYPVFYLSQKKKKPKLLKELDDKSKSAQLQSIEDICYLEVEEEKKFDTFGHMCEALHPVVVFVAIKDLGSRKLVERLEEQFDKECEFVVTEHDGYSVISFSLGHKAYTVKKSLTVIYDLSVPQKALDKENSLNVMLLTPDERRLVTQKLNIPEYSPASFASLHTSK
ncbi:hypothetical protein ACQ4PT_039747 [Festuca glaucescens]